MNSSENKRYAYFMVNGLTMLRFLLSGYFIKFLLENQTNFWVYVVLFTAIGLSDFFDGRLARRFCVQSETGAKLDVLADSFFIFSASYVLYLQRSLGLWVLIMMFLKLIEFFLTSKYLRKNEASHVFLFDKIGKSLAVFFYLLPILTIGMRAHLQPELFLVIQRYLFVMMFFTCAVSTFSRISRCIDLKLVFLLSK